MLSISEIFGILSMLFYAIVYFPQLYTIFRLKTLEGLSLLTVNIWCIADCFNLIALLILQLETSLIIIGWYHMLMTCILLITSLFYMKLKHNELYEVEANSQIVMVTNFKKFVIMYLSILVVIICISLSIIFEINYNNDSQKLSSLKLFGEILAWISIIMYFCARLPQVYKNYKGKTTYGLSKNMFFITILANIFYLLTILTVSLEYDYIIKNLPWIIFVISTTLIDFVILLQCIYY